LANAWVTVVPEAATAIRAAVLKERRTILSRHAYALEVSERGGIKDLIGKLKDQATAAVTCRHDLTDISIVRRSVSE
jgi:hypothetical protein